MRTLNRQWFVDRLRDAGQSQRALARFLELDASAITHILNGKRRLQLDEVERVARFLSRPVEEVLTQAGLDLGGEVRAPSVPLIGHLDRNAVVRVRDKQPEIEAPFYIGMGVQAVRAKTAGGAFEIFDGAYLYFGPFYSPGAAAPETFMQRLCAVMVNDKAVHFGTLRQGYAPGTYNVVSEAGVVEDISDAVIAPMLYVSYEPMHITPAARTAPRAAGSARRSA